MKQKKKQQTLKNAQYRLKMTFNNYPNTTTAQLKDLLCICNRDLCVWN